MKFVVSTQVGEPVAADAPGTVAHRYRTPAGEAVVVRRDVRGRLLPGAKLTRLRGGEGRPPTSADSRLRQALGLVTRSTESKRRKREEDGK